MLIEEYKLRRQINSRGLMFNMVKIVNNTILCA